MIAWQGSEDQVQLKKFDLIFCTIRHQFPCSKKLSLISISGKKSETHEKNDNFFKEEYEKVVSCISIVYSMFARNSFQIYNTYKLPNFLPFKRWNPHHSSHGTFVNILPWSCDNRHDKCFNLKVPPNGEWCIATLAGSNAIWISMRFHAWNHINPCDNFMPFPWMKFYSSNNVFIRFHAWKRHEIIVWNEL